MTFEKIKKNFGFGMMRLPTDAAGVIDSEQVKQMVDLFIGSGFNYFDTAHGYHEGKSEEAVRECLAERYPREAFVLTDKLTAFMFDSEDDIYKVFEEQLKICGVDYFDFYLMHSQGKVNYDHFKRCNAYAAAQKLKAQKPIENELYAKYEVKRGLRDLNGEGVVAGSRVKVPFGGRVVDGFVVGVSATSAYPPEKIKPVSFVYDEPPALVEECFFLMNELAARYRVPKAVCLRLFLPAEMRAGRVHEVYKKLVKPFDLGISLPKSAKKQAEF